ncbi:DNA processing protein DprA [Allosaccharopolyspora coralli]|uniref:DNA processing protein DprA n=1 Tax=Allosaccharopolyspora coralli TaxID=2665642 RepID=A0A5Q3QB06_9PSEU|nr:DNA-processing protein DprA [Allosaccharopolyspora coralli]QGK71030.1 DNA processing protein DprA [Allosaccharopolyspora coralli]
MTTPDEEVLVARAYLSAVAEPPAPAVCGFVSAHGPVEAAARVVAGDVPRDVEDEVQARRGEVSGSALLESARRAGLRLLTPEHAGDWPTERFGCFEEATAIGLAGVAPPLALWTRGSRSLARALDRSCAIVGARAASGYGEHVSAEWAHGLVSAGVTVVSGAAYGIDGAAHRGALAARGSGTDEAHGVTVAFVASGADVDYPAGHARLLATVAERGLVLSEYPPATMPRKHRFLVRNRLIAGAGAGTVVVEAGARSGAGNTASTAESLGRPVMAAPGPVTSASSVGCHAMIRSGKAVLVTRPDDVLELINPMGSAPPEQGSPKRVTDEVGSYARRVHEALWDGASAEQLAVSTGLPPGKVRAVLPELEFAGLARRGDEGWSRVS